ncbi:hypothetical protein EZS27_015097 [termite gut metagenome]|uniref:Uncharacterized protein n=1 Tax=termite gut metagenome TaxID=433724 RepID=A0A5J4RRZ8_9ZZZZ
MKKQIIGFLVFDIFCSFAYHLLEKSNIFSTQVFVTIYSNVYYGNASVFV